MITGEEIKECIDDIVQHQLISHEKNYKRVFTNADNAVEITRILELEYVKIKIRHYKLQISGADDMKVINKNFVNESKISVHRPHKELIKLVTTIVNNDLEWQTT